MGSGDTDDSESSAGPSRSSACPPAETSTLPPQGKGRSLGSLAGFVNSLTFLTRSKAPPASSSQIERLTTSPLLARSTSDGDVVDALTKRFTPGKRTVLEPIEVGNDISEDTKVQWGLVQGKGDREESNKRVTKKAEGQRVVLPRTRDTSDDEEDALVEGLIDVSASGPACLPFSMFGQPPAGYSLTSQTPSRPSSRISRRPSLHLPIPTLPSWSFPLPSPPVISLSPNIPSELFQTKIENPIVSASTCRKKSSTTTSHRHSVDRSVDLSIFPGAALADEDLPSPVEQDRREIDETLSPVGSFATLPDPTSSGSTSCPSTPERCWVRDFASPDTDRKSFREKKLFAKYAQYTDDDVEELMMEERSLDEKFLGARLSRTSSGSSGRSCDSKETIRPGNEGEVTPKAGRGWRAVEAGVGGA